MSHMTTPQIVLSVIYFLVALALVAIVMLQSGKSAGLSGAIAVFMLLTLIICLL